jgi:NitT/TauT family transport system substrate-binding protein
MKEHHAVRSSRREFMGRAGLAAAAGLLSMPRAESAAEPPPETTTLRTAHGNTMCEAPQSLAEELLRAEGFTDVRYVVTPNVDQELAAGKVDMVLRYSAPLSVMLDNGVPVVILAGVHIGCIDLFVSKEVRSVRELKGRRVAMDKAIGSATDLFLATILAHVGLHPRRDVQWVDTPLTEWPAGLTAGKLDGFLSWPPYAQELREKQIGRVILSTATDRPWSQYFCCMVATRKEYVEKYPVATKRALRAFLKATDVCAQEPGRVARWLVDRGYTKRIEIAERMLRELPYNKWREYDPEDTFRFYALRLHESGLIKSSPKKLIAQGTDWRFLNELKKELKG